MWPIWCNLKYGIAKWKCAATERWCEIVRNDGAACNVVWFGMSEMVFDVE